MEKIIAVIKNALKGKALAEIALIIKIVIENLTSILDYEEGKIEEPIITQTGHPVIDELIHFILIASKLTIFQTMNDKIKSLIAEISNWLDEISKPETEEEKNESTEEKIKEFIENAIRALKGESPDVQTAKTNIDNALVLITPNTKEKTQMVTNTTMPAGHTPF